MKFAFTIVSLVLAGTMMAQNTDKNEQDSDANDAIVETYIGLGVLSQSSTNLNSRLAAASLSTIPQTLPEFVVGFNVFGKKYSGNLEITGATNRLSAAANKTMMQSGSVRGMFHYNVTATKKSAFTAGLNLAYAYSTLNVYNENAVIDFNNLNPQTAGSQQFTLRNGRLFFGPSASLYLFRDKFCPIRLTAAYEFGLTPGTWCSDFSNVANSVNERGTNRFMVNLVFGLGSTKDKKK